VYKKQRKLRLYSVTFAIPSIKKKKKENKTKQKTKRKKRRQLERHMIYPHFEHSIFAQL
jgi:hypothetical protein